MTDTTPAKSREHAQLERQYSELMVKFAAMKVRAEAAEAKRADWEALSDHRTKERDGLREAMQSLFSPLTLAYVRANSIRRWHNDPNAKVKEWANDIVKCRDEAHTILCKALEVAPFRGLEMDSAGEVREVGDGE